MQHVTTSGVLDCCECGAVVGTEGPQRGTLLLPCQHILHMGCVEFIKRRGKLFMGMNSVDVIQEDGGDLMRTSSPLNRPMSSSSNNSNFSRQMHGRCLCPACNAPITHIIPLYLRSEDDPRATSERHSVVNATAPASASSPATLQMEEDYKRVHTVQKQVLVRLRNLCEQRRRLTELTHACANLHEQRARYLADMEKEVRCFPGLINSSDEQDDTTYNTSARSTRDSREAASAPSGIPIEHMGITELELYVAQVTPRLLHAQAELRKERQLLERRTKKLNVLRSHYHTTKELHALDAEIGERLAQVRGCSKKSTVHLHEDAKSTPHPLPPSQQQQHATSSEQQPQQQSDNRDVEREELSLCRGVDVPARKKVRGEGAIDVDEEPPAEVVEVLSQETSDADEREVMVLDDEDVAAEVGQDSGAEFVDEDNDTADNASNYEAPYLIPCYVRSSNSAVTSSATPKMPRPTLTYNYVRMLPRREDRLWQPSLKF